MGGEMIHSDLSKLPEIMNEVTNEVHRACAKFPSYNSPHEGLAIIQEEFEELKAEVFKQFSARGGENLRKEAKQVACTAIRFMVDIAP